MAYMHTNRIFFTPSSGPATLRFRKAPAPTLGLRTRKSRTLRKIDGREYVWIIETTTANCRTEQMNVAPAACERQRGKTHAACKKEIERNNQSIAFRLGYSITLIVGSAAAKGAGRGIHARGAWKIEYLNRNMERAGELCPAGFLLLDGIFAYL